MFAPLSKIKISIKYIMSEDKYLVQSVIFDKSVYSPRQAKKWLQASGYKAPKMDETAHYLRFRQVSPTEAKKQGFADYNTKPLGNGDIKLVIAYPSLTGGKMKASEISDFIDASYSKNPPKELDGFTLDSKLSNDIAKVYYNPNTGEARIIHRGTEGLKDWGNNLAYIAGAYELTDRYKRGKKVQEQAEKKYGKKNISTLGHSQGAVLARKLGADTKEVINVNPAFKGEKPKKNEYNIRSSADVVSGLYAPVAKVREVLNPKEKRHDITIKAESFNPLKEHSADILGRLGEKEIGVGAGRRVNGRTSDTIWWYL
jgi:hypothetical protein